MIPVVIPLVMIGIAALAGAFSACDTPLALALAPLTLAAGIVLGLILGLGSFGPLDSSARRVDRYPLWILAGLLLLHHGRSRCSPPLRLSSSPRGPRRRRRDDAEFWLELLVLRHQLGVLQRQVKRPRRQTADRLLVSVLSQRLPRRVNSIPRLGSTQVLSGELQNALPALRVARAGRGRGGR